MDLLAELNPLHRLLAAFVAVTAADRLCLRRARGRSLTGLFYFCFAFATIGASALLRVPQAFWWASEAKSWTPEVGVVTAAEASFSAPAWRR
ncbi:MAG: hypothetical protein AAF690_01145 [Acidobacteriota bacterium]